MKLIQKIKVVPEKNKLVNSNNALAGKLIIKKISGIK